MWFIALLPFPVSAIKSERKKFFNCNARCLRLTHCIIHFYFLFYYVYLKCSKYCSSGERWFLDHSCGKNLKSRYFWSSKKIWRNYQNVAYERRVTTGSYEYTECKFWTFSPYLAIGLYGSGQWSSQYII